MLKMATNNEEWVNQLYTVKEVVSYHLDRNFDSDWRPMLFIALSKVTPDICQYITALLSTFNLRMRISYYQTVKPDQ
jgi:hypothetical protein